MCCSHFLYMLTSYEVHVTRTVTLLLISKLCRAMFHCSANALSSMLQGTAFYLIHRFAHTLKFQDDDVLNIAKVYANIYIFTPQ